MGAANICYCAILFCIYDNWKKEKLTLADCGEIMKSKTHFNFQLLSEAYYQCFFLYLKRLKLFARKNLASLLVILKIT